MSVSAMMMKVNIFLTMTTKYRPVGNIDKTWLFQSGEFN